MPRIGKKAARSDFEFQVFKALSNVLPRGAKLEYEVTKLPYVIEHEYNPDFTITKRDGSVILVEAKGLGRRGGFDYDAQRKMAEIKKQHPEKDIRIIFMKDGLIRKGGKMRASDWALKNGYKFCVGVIPNDWFELEPDQKELPF